MKGLKRNKNGTYSLNFINRLCLANDVFKDMLKDTNIFMAVYSWFYSILKEINTEITISIKDENGQEHYL